MLSLGFAALALAIMVILQRCFDGRSPEMIRALFPWYGRTGRYATGIYFLLMVVMIVLSRRERLRPWYTFIGFGVGCSFLFMVHALFCWYGWMFTGGD